MAKVMMGWKLAEILAEHGIVPPLTRRVVIDIRHDAAVEIFYACFGDERLLNVNLPAYLHDAICVEVGADRQPTEDVDDLPPGVTRVTTFESGQFEQFATIKPPADERGKRGN